MKPYKGYNTTISFDADDRLFHGIVEGIRDTVHFAGSSVDELEQAFHDSVDDYLAMCAEDGVTPEKPYSGKLAFRTSPDRHRLIADAAAMTARSINQWMDSALEDAARKTLANNRRDIRHS